MEAGCVADSMAVAEKEAEAAATAAAVSGAGQMEAKTAATREEAEEPVEAVARARASWVVLKAEWVAAMGVVALRARAVEVPVAEARAA